MHRYSPRRRSATAAPNASDATIKLLKDTEASRFVRGGDDASCLSIYQPREPTLLGASDSFIQRGGFAFSGTVSDANAEERKNPWLLLERDFGNDVIPAIGDQETLDYALKVGLGKDLEIRDEAGRPAKLRVVAGLAGSIFQGQLLVAESKLLARFPNLSGYRAFLFDLSKHPAAQADLIRALELDLTDYGFDVTPTAERLAAFRAVANTYIATFQTLGGLGLLLGTVGLATVLLRNVLERQARTGRSCAIGFRSRLRGSCWRELLRPLVLRSASPP